MATVETPPEAAPPAGAVYDGFVSYSHAADDLLAPGLQAGLVRFAKPWWKRRALRIFRDEASLSANPHLWESITEAMTASGWLVLLLSPDAAASEWVNREVEWWRTHNDPTRIIPVLTDGEFGWVDGDVAGDAVPDALRGTFSDEPRWVDMRFARSADQLDLRNGAFRAAVADIASAIRGVPKDELESEEVKQHRRTVRTAWAAGVALLVLTIAAGAAAVYANGQRREAQTNATEAETQRDIAQQQTQRAETLEFDARSDALAASASAQVDTDPELALLLATLALERDPQPPALSATHQALQRHRGIYEAWIEAGDLPVPRAAAGGMSPDGRLLALVTPGRDLEVWEVGATGPLWTEAVDSDLLYFYGARFTQDGDAVIALVGPANLIDPFEPSDDGGGSLLLFDAASGDRIDSIELSGCPLSLDPDPLPLFVDLTKPLPWVASNVCWEFRVDVGLLDESTGSFDAITQATAGQSNYWSRFGVATSDAGRRLLAVGAGGPGQVIDVETGEQVLSFDGGVSTLSPDGRRILIRGHGAGRPLELWDLTIPQMRWSFPKTLTRAWFSHDESLVYGTSQDGSVYVIDAGSGAQIHRLSGQGGLPIAATMTDDGRTLATHSTDGSVRVWDLGAMLSEGPVYASLSTPHLQVPASVDLAGGLLAVWGGAASDEAPWEIAVVELASGETVLRVDGGVPALSPDGTLLAYRAVDEVDVTEDDLKEPGATGLMRRVGPVRIVDIETGELVHDLALRCEQYLTGTQAVPSAGCTIAEGGTGWDLEFSPDGTTLAMSDSYNDRVLVWDTETGTPLFEDDLPGANSRAVAFTDSQMVNLYSGGIDYRLAVYNLGPGEDGRVTAGGFAASVTLPGGTSFAEIVTTPDGSLVAAADNSGQITMIETDTWDLLEPIAAHDGEALDVATSPDGTLLASVGDDAFLRVWNLGDRSLLTEVQFDVAAVTNVEFIDDEHLLVGPGFGDEAIEITLDPDELLDLARSRLLRGFTSGECVRFAIDPCPTLEKLTGG